MTSAPPSRVCPSGDSAPVPLAGFEHINRYWDRTRDAWVAKILPGEYYVTRGRELITTVLGSCISACITDKNHGFGGMNHFMLPQHTRGDSPTWAGTTVNAATRYGNYAMEHLINDILSHGGRREHMELKVFGGGKVLSSMTDVGQRNIDFTEGYIRSERLKLIGEDVGDIFPRKVLYDPSNGRVWVKKLRSLHNNTIVERERRYMHEIEREPVTGGVELF